MPVTWAATERARARRPPRPPFARAHVRAHPRPTWGLRRRRLQSTPSQHSTPNPGPRAESIPGSFLFSLSPSPASGLHHVPRAPAHLSRGAGLRGPLGEVPPPWPLSAPATALAPVAGAAAAGSSTAGPRRFQVGPRLPLLPLPAVPAAPSGPLLSPRRWDGLAAVAAGALTTPPAGNCSRCSAGGPGAAEVRPRDPPLSPGGGWSEGRTQSIPCDSLT